MDGNLVVLVALLADNFAVAEADPHIHGIQRCGSHLDEHFIGTATSRGRLVVHGDDRFRSLVRVAHESPHPRRSFG